ncbi:MAG TPA: hypothetical protein VG943_07610 [Caulobacterales bacterium]|nr:hypothetical protein [Caulobacterales bacterium]
MKATLTIAALAATFAVCACGVFGAKYPEFRARAYRLEGMASPPGATAPLRTVIYRDGARMRVETDLPQHGRAAVVFDEPSNAPYVLDPVGSPWARQSAAETPTTQISANAGQAATIAPHPGAVVTAPPRALGVAVRIADADAPQPMETFWAALGPDNVINVGPCAVAGERGEQWRPRPLAQSIDRVACITSDGIVLQLRESGRVLFQATRLTRGRQNPTLFGVPIGYRKLDPNHVSPAESVMASAAP